MPHRKSNSEPAGSLGSEMVRVLIGPEKKSFAIHKKLLCSTSHFFRDSLAAIPDGLTGSLSSSKMTVLWFSGESPEMFDLFVLWLYHRQSFGATVERAVSSIVAAEADTGDHRLGTARLGGLRWALVHLHLFAAAVDLPALQDASMDAIQDLYLRLDWDVSPRFVRSLYERRPAEAFRMRKWAVAMVAWTMSSGASSGRCNGEIDSTATTTTTTNTSTSSFFSSSSSASSSSFSPDEIVAQFQQLMKRFPEFKDDYAAHLRKMAGSRANVCIKNPQLRIPSNSLRHEERNFGFRMCSFHSHRAAVGQGRCPHAAADDARHSVMVMPVSSTPCTSALVRPGSRNTTASRASVSSHDDADSSSSSSFSPTEKATIGVAMTAVRHRSRSDLGFKPTRISSVAARHVSTLPTVPPTPNDPATYGFF